MILPGSHHRLIDREAIAHYGDILGQLSLTVPAGSVALTRYGIWHKAGPKLNAVRRGMIKFSYYRTALPKRDWVTESAAIPAYREPVRHPVEEPLPPPHRVDHHIPLSDLLACAAS